MNLLTVILNEVVKRDFVSQEVFFVFFFFYTVVTTAFLIKDSDNHKPSEPVFLL